MVLETGHIKKTKLLCTLLQEQRPMHSFEDNSDYVYDARWSPVHPALFATVDGNGRLDLWNLNNDTEVSCHILYSRHYQSVGFKLLVKCRLCEFILYL